MGIMRKPGNTPKYRKNAPNQMMKNNLSGIVHGVLSGRKTRERTYLETIWRQPDVSAEVAIAVEDAKEWLS